MFYQCILSSVPCHLFPILICRHRSFAELRKAFDCNSRPTKKVPGQKVPFLVKTPAKAAGVVLIRERLQGLCCSQPRIPGQLQGRALGEMKVHHVMALAVISATFVGTAGFSLVPWATCLPRTASSLRTGRSLHMRSKAQPLQIMLCSKQAVTPMEASRNETLKENRDVDSTSEKRNSRTLTEKVQDADSCCILVILMCSCFAS